MRKNFLMRSFHLVTIGVLFSIASMRGDVFWTGGPQSVDVVDTDLHISNDNSIVGGVQIISNVNPSVNVYIDVNDAIVRGSSVGLGGPSRLFFVTTNVVNSINVYLDFDLTFYGSPDGTPLLLMVYGPGNVNFHLNSDQVLTFGQDGLGGGTRFFLQMAQAVTGVNPFITFNRTIDGGSDDVTIDIGPNSIMSYLALVPTALGSTEGGDIFFNAANSGTGRMVLQIENTGAFLAQGNLLTTSNTPPNIFVTDIDQTTLAGQIAVAFIDNQIGAAVSSSLEIINLNTVYPSLMEDPFVTGSFDGFRAGFILGANGLLGIDDYSYIDYVGTTTNVCLDPAIDPTVLAGRSVEDIIKPRNASAFIVDGDPAFTSTAQIQFGNYSGLYFRSGCNANGVVDPFSDGSYLIDPAQTSTGFGNILLDVEGPVIISDFDLGNNAIEILSIAVFPTGGPLRQDLTGSTFPLRNFSAEGIYNKGAFFINNSMRLENIWLVHSDSNHLVLEKNDFKSEPTYVGGDYGSIVQNPAIRPYIEFINSNLYVETNIAFTGVDLSIPNLDAPQGNISNFTFFYNGNVIDDCSGRQMILGTFIGSEACDGCTPISRDAHLNIIQTYTQVSGVSPEILNLLVAPNTYLVDDQITGTILNQFDLNTIYLGWASNISVGSELGYEPALPLVTFPTLNLAGDYFSFDTRGGLSGSPDTGNVTGQGAIFVDQNGNLTIDPNIRANVSTMIVKGGTAINPAVINWPENQVFLNLAIGISDWKLDLANPIQRIIITPGQALSEYNMNWLATIKDYANFTPYPFYLASTDPLSCPPVVAANIASLPTVQGTINQFQIQGARLGCPAYVLNDCGWIQELVFLRGCNSGEEPNGVLVMQNEGRTGIGTANRNLDSLYAMVKLGINGLNIIADGTCRIDLNENLVIDNICAILKGPDFTPTDTSLPGNVFTIHADTPTTIRVTKDGVLDLRSFSDPRDTILFDGFAQIIFEPGATLIMGGGLLQFFDSSSMIIEPYYGCNPLDGATVADSDDRRVRFMGTGLISFEDLSFLEIQRYAYLGVETDVTIAQVLNTNLTLQFLDSGKFLIGQEFNIQGGIFQVGNTSAQSITEGDITIPATINFTLTLNGDNVYMSMGSAAMVGFGVGIVNDVATAQNDWLVDTLFDVESISINIPDGVLSHNHVFDGSNSAAALMAFGPSTNGYSLDVDVIVGEILGGGNIIQLSPGIGSAPINPTVLGTNGVINSRLSAGIISSGSLLHDISGVIKPDIVSPVTQTEIFNYLSVADSATVSNTRGVAGAPNNNYVGVIIGYVSDGEIIRRFLESIIDPNGAAISQGDEALAIAAVQLLFPGEDPQSEKQGAVAFTIPQQGSRKNGLSKSVE